MCLLLILSFLFRAVGSEVLTAVVMKSSIFWDTTPCSPLKANWRFGATCRLHLQGRKISRAKRPAWNRSADFQQTTRRYIPEDITLPFMSVYSLSWRFQTRLLNFRWLDNSEWWARPTSSNLSICLKGLGITTKALSPNTPRLCQDTNRTSPEYKGEGVPRLNRLYR
jgi:hypothetical protein